jgi:hypothetical protein
MSQGTKLTRKRDNTKRRFLAKNLLELKRVKKCDITVRVLVIRLKKYHT